jgi:hypothetical protein
MDDLAALTHQIEYLFLRKIITGLQSKSINVSESKKYANAFLAIEPFKSADDAHAKITAFVSSNVPFTELKEYMDAYQDKKDELAKIAKMKEHLKQNNIKEAIAVAKA